MQIIITQCTWLASTPICLFCSICEFIDREMNGKRQRRIYAFNRLAIEPIGTRHTEVKNQHIFHFNACEHSVRIFENMGTESKVCVVFSAGCAVIDDDFLFVRPIHLLLSIAYIVRERFSPPFRLPSSPPEITIQFLINAYVIRIEMDSFSRCWL